MVTPVTITSAFAPRYYAVMTKNTPTILKASNKVEQDHRASRPIAINAEAGNVPAFIQLLPSGKVEGRDGRYWYNNSPDAIVEAFIRNNGDIVIDYEHATEWNWDNDAVPAAGWIKALENRSGEIWANVEWTDKAASMIGAKEYRFISPVFYYNAESLDILAIASVGLTHSPNLDLVALNKREDNLNRMEGNLAMNREEYLALCESLGLRPDASVDSVMTAVATNKRAATPDLTQFVPRADFDAMQERAEKAENTIKDNEQKAINSEIEGLVASAIEDGKIQPAQKDYHVAACKVEGGIDNFKKFIGEAGQNPLAQNSGLNDAAAKGASGSLSPDEKAICKQMGVSEADFIKSKEMA